MQHEVSCTVRLFIRPPPDVLIRHVFQTINELWQEVVFQKHPRCFDEFLTFCPRGPRGCEHSVLCSDSTSTEDSLNSKIFLCGDHRGETETTGRYSHPVADTRPGTRLNSASLFVINRT